MQHAWCQNACYAFPPLFFHFNSLPFPPTIARAHRSLTRLWRCVLHQMSECVSLSACKATNLEEKKTLPSLLLLEEHYTQLQVWKKLILLGVRGETRFFFSLKSSLKLLIFFKTCFSVRVIYQKQSKTKAATEDHMCVWVWQSQMEVCLSLSGFSWNWCNHVCLWVWVVSFE